MKTTFENLKQTVSTLRGPDGCPWDKKQTHETLIKCLQNESQELIDAINNNDDENMKEELGDVLLQVLMHAQIAQEEGKFTIEDVMAYLDEKNYDDFKYIIRPIQNGQLMILNHEDDKRKIQGSNAILLDSSIYGINQTKKKLFQKAEKPFKQIFTLYSKVISIKEVNYNKKIKYMAIIPFGINHGMNEAIKNVYIHDKLYPVVKILNEFIYVEVDSLIKKDMQVEITSIHNPIDTYLSSQTLNYFSMFSSNIPIVFDDYILEKASMY